MKKISFNTRKNILAVFTVIACLSVIALRFVWVKSNDWKSIAFYVAVMVLVVAYFILTVILWRCPYCGKYLGKLDFGIHSCKHCDKSFFEDNAKDKFMK